MFSKPVAEDPRITTCLNAKRESKAVEFKEQFLPTDPRQALEVLKDIVAIADDVRKFIEKRVREMHDQLVKGLRKVSEAPRGSQLQVVPRGARAIGPAGAVAVRLTTNPDAQGILVTDRHEIFPYRQKDVIAKLKEVLPAGSVPNTYDLQAINKVYKIAHQENLSWQPPFLSRLYSNAFVEWIIDKLSNQKHFLQDTRGRLHEINLKNKSGQSQARIECH